jgi:molybdate transport system regulatory protein
VNQLHGRIMAIETDGHLSVVEVNVGRDTLTAMVLEAPANAPYLAEGNAIAVLFKETEVSLGKNLAGQLSLRNRLRGTVRHIRRGKILSEVALDYQGQTLTSIVTTRAVASLGLAEGDEVEALVKANEVSLTEVRDEL